MFAKLIKSWFQGLKIFLRIIAIGIFSLLLLLVLGKIFLAYLPFDRNVKLIWFAITIAALLPVFFAYLSRWDKETQRNKDSKFIELWFDGGKTIVQIVVLLFLTSLPWRLLEIIVPETNDQTSYWYHIEAIVILLIDPLLTLYAARLIKFTKLEY